MQEGAQEILITSVSPEGLSGSPANRLSAVGYARISLRGERRFRVAPLVGDQGDPIACGVAMRSVCKILRTPGHVAQDSLLSEDTLRSGTSADLCGILTFAEERTSTGLI